MHVGAENMENEEGNLKTEFCLINENSCYQTLNKTVYLNEMPLM